MFEWYVPTTLRAMPPTTNTKKHMSLKEIGLHVGITITILGSIVFDMIEET